MTCQPGVRVRVRGRGRGRVSNLDLPARRVARLGRGRDLLRVRVRVGTRV